MRARRRPKSMMSRLVASLAALAVAVGAAVGVAACAHGGPSATVSADASVSVAAPVVPSSVAAAGVEARAFGGHGRLAFVSGGRLYVLDGSAAGQTATLHAIASGPAPGQTPGSPAWSPDGRWLAYLVGTPAADGAVTRGALWLAGPDGQDARQALAKVAGFAWSPKADEVAATSGNGGKLFAVRPGKPTYPMLEVPGQFDGAPAWSPNGRELAVATVDLTAAKRFASSVIDLFVPSEGIVVNSLVSSRTDALLLDGWWTSGEGLLAWSDPRDSASAAANGLPLVSYALDGPTATLGMTLAYPSFAVPGQGGVTLVSGGDRSMWNAKTITGCSFSGKCGLAMDATPAPVNLDPAQASSRWGEPILAFVHGAAETTAGSTQRDLNAWYRTRQLWVWVGTGGNPHSITRAGVGVAAPSWSADSQDILYVRDNALWLIPVFQANGYPSAAPAQLVVGSLFAGSWPNANGYTAWQTQFAWHS
jgi:dipeptidyl aminopeptidase/acylaminoacyl peptidase